jgi:glycosyltransferase involved in cell wall biosynthesis
MDTIEPYPGRAVFPSSRRAGAGGRSRRERLAIVSTTNRLCGIAAYTASLHKQLSSVFDVTVFDLDQYLLRGRQDRLRKLGDRHIKEICRELRRFDAVNLQLEYGTLGRSPKDIYRRFCWLLAAAPRLSVTFHTLLPPPRFSPADFARKLITGHFRTALRLVGERRRSRILSAMVAARLRHAQHVKQIAAIVHTRHDLKEVRYLYGLDNVFDHPLAFLTAEEAAIARRRSGRRNFPLLDRVAGDAVLTGVFGFLNDYKGVETAIQALRHLSEDHHLLIFGGIHPNEIRMHTPIHPYLSKLFDNARVDATPYDRIGKAPLELALDAKHGLTELLGPDPGDLSERIHFMGVPDNEEFLSGMVSCDVVVFPYLEVGQSASGPISQALELGCRVIASRTHTFLGLADYHPGAIEFFEIGNHLELADRIAARRQYPQRDGLPRFNVETNTAAYLAANSKLAARRTRSARIRVDPARASAGP